MEIYKENEIKKIKDDFGKAGAKPYIYTSNYKWFILHWVGEPCFVENFSCNLYNSKS